MPKAQGFRYIVAARDDLSGAAEGRKLRKTSSQAIANFIFEELLCRYGAIGELVTDNGPETRDAVVILVQRYGIPHIRISAYNSKGNGVVERGHFTIRESLLKLCADKPSKWPELVAHAFWADRVTFRRATGFSPYRLLYGVDPVLPFDLAEATYLVSGFTAGLSSSDLLALRIRQLQKRDSDMASAAATIRDSRLRSKAQFEKHFARRLRTTEFAPDSLVLVRNVRRDSEASGKFSPRYAGPYQVIRRTRNGAYLLKELDGTPSRQPFAAFRIVPYFSRNGAPISPDSLLDDNFNLDNSADNSASSASSASSSASDSESD